MGLTQSKTDVSTEINQSVFNELLNQISTSGSGASNSQQTDVSGLNIVMVGNENCKEHPTITIKNESQMQIDNMIDIASKSFADTLASLKASVDNTKGADSLLFGDSGNTTIKTATNETIKNAIASKMDSECRDAENYQKINVKDSLMDLTCASLDISNKNIQQASCIMNSISEVTSELKGKMDTSVKNDIGNNEDIVNMLMYIAIIVIVIIIFIIGIIVFIKSKALRKMVKGVPRAATDATGDASGSIHDGNNSVQQSPAQIAPQTTTQIAPQITTQNGLQTVASAVTQLANSLNTLNNGNYQVQNQNAPNTPLL